MMSTNFSARRKKLLSDLSGYSAAVSQASQASLLRLPPSLISVMRARVSYDIGPRFHSLFDFRRKAASHWNDYLLDRDFKKRLREANGDQRAFTGDKVRFTAHCVENGLTTIPILALIDSQPTAASAAFARPTSADELAQVLERAPARLFVKLIDGTLGIDAFALTREAGQWRFCNQMGSASELHRFLLGRLCGRRGWMMQPFVEANASLRRIMAPNALGTIRAITFWVGEEPKIAVPILRIPAGDNVADNFSHGLSGNLVAPIDLASGTLGRARYSRNRSWPDIVVTDRHPDTGGTITGFTLPFWRETKDLLIRAQASIPHMKTVGWDIAITDDGPLIVEANSTYDVDLLQVAYDRGLRREFDCVLEGRRLASGATS
jgi:hypothetical protein